MERFYAEPLLDINSFLHPVRQSFWPDMDAFVRSQPWPRREHFRFQFLDNNGSTGIAPILRRL